MNTLEQKLIKAQKTFRRKLLFSVIAAVLLFAVVFPLVYFVRPVSLQISPPLAAQHAIVSVVKGVGLVLFDSAYLLGENAVLNVAAAGFISQKVAVDVGSGAKHLRVELRAAPVSVVITTDPPLPRTRWRVDGAYAGTAERFAQEMRPGKHNVEIDHEFYFPQKLAIDVQIGTDFMRHLELTQVSGSIGVVSEPRGALVVLGGEEKGLTPVQIASVPGGLHRLQVKLAEYENIEEEIAVTNHSANILRDYHLQLKRTEVRLAATPAGGVLRVNGIAVDEASSLFLPIGEKHIIAYEKTGYLPQSREVLLRENDPVEMSFQLEKEMGQVVINSTPPAKVHINGKPMGATPQKVFLQALRQKISLRRPGYRSVELTVAPSAAAPLLIDQKLKTEFAARLSEAQPLLTAAAGITMKFFDPRAGAKNRFTMGAPLSDRFRRANEFQREVHLSKPFYVSINEISEEQFSQYKPRRGSGKHHPMRNVSWSEAAGFCNWMSKQGGLPPAYKIAGGRVLDFDETSDGYRLLSEAEWEWLARVAGRDDEARFVWGNADTIPKDSGNFADESAKGRTPEYIPRYNDGFAGVAPVASFPVDAAGLHDMAGNLSEWVHDSYDLLPPTPGLVARNPFGGQQGDSRVIKGASFRSASITVLRSSYRDGLSKGRDDVGFRVARYLYGKDQEEAP